MSAPDTGDVKSRILARVDIAALIGERVKLQRSSGHMVGCCPFHAEKTPSFYVYPDHYNCYGCKAHGDAIDYVRHTEGLGFYDALRWLAAKYGVEAPELAEARGRLGAQRQDAALYRMMLEAQELYVSVLHGPGGAAALAYLKKRGFSDESIKDFGFGLTPPGGHDLVRHLRAKGYRDDDMIACSLATASTRDGRAFDFLRNRVTLPIHDTHGRIIAFGGRTLDGAQPKYLNSRESRLFDKSRTLFGFSRARKVMRERGRAIVCEGYMDVLQLWQQGFPEAVACLGTAFTETQMKLLQQATGLVVLLFDGDSAGQKATLGAVSVALSVPGVQVRAAALPGGDDPDTFVLQHGATALTSQLEQKSVDLLDFAVREKIKSTHALGLPELVTKEFVPWLARVPDLVQRGFLVNRIAQLSGVPGPQIEAQLRQSAAPQAQAARAARAAATANATQPTPPTFPPLDRVGHDFFGHVYHSQPGELDPETLRQIAKDELDLGPEYTALLDEFFVSLSVGEAPSSHDTGKWTSALDPGLAALVERLAAESAAFSCSDRRLRLERLRRERRRQYLKTGISRCKAEMTRAAADPARAAELTTILRAIGELTRELSTLERPEASP